MKVQIKVLDKHYVSYIETCLQFLGSGTYMLEDGVFTLNVNPLHANMPNEFISNVMKREGHNPNKVYEYITK
ncbi:MAG: hypothetical protein MJZ37_05225 [Bacilli bacterium]|nr:hypothetical protein [Bacilli bacterium]